VSDTQTLDTIILTNNCTCADEESLSLDRCYGDCYEDTFSVLSMVVENWREMNSHKASDYLRVDGEGMTWQHLSGYLVTEVTKDLTETIVNALRINGDWTLTFRVSTAGDLSVVRSSHDELGASFSVTFVPEEIALAD